MDERKRFLEAHDYYDRQDIGYYNDYTGKGMGCSGLQVACLRRAEIINDNESFHAASGYVGVLADTDRFERLPADTKQIDGDIQWYHGSHVSNYNSKGGKYPNGRNEAAPHKNSAGRITHPLNDRGGEVGFWHDHNFECASVPLTCIYRIKEKGEQKDMSKIEIAISVMEKIANDNRIGYCNEYPNNRGKKGYDCGAFVSKGWEVAGVFPEDAYYEPMGSGSNYKLYNEELLIKSGFLRIEYGRATKQRGDILVSGGHTATYLGSNRMIHARSDYDGRIGDSSGKEITETPFYENNWVYIFRYVGDQETPVLQQGMFGEPVKTLQKMLNDKISAGLSLDGSFGPLTVAAVKKYQERNGLEADGSVGPKTWAKLKEKAPAMKAEDILNEALKVMDNQYGVDPDRSKKLKSLFGDAAAERIQAVVNLASKAL